MRLRTRSTRWFTCVLTVMMILPMACIAQESVWPLEDMEPDMQNLPSLQNGFKLFVNYCIGCHSLKYQRYQRTADDLGIPHDIALDNLVFTGQKIGELMVNSMDPERSKYWFGAPPPDLTMVARVRGTDWLYTYLKTFYLDPGRVFGVNNKVFNNVGMPNVLMELQGTQTEKCVQVPKRDEDGTVMRDPLDPAKVITEERCDELAVQEGTGLMTPKEFDQAVYDIVNFLYYTGDPNRLERHRIGIFVLLFLVILYVFTHLLAREYRKEVKH